MNLTEKLNRVQTNLNAPKDAFNSFAKYNYRSAESILQAVKPLLKETGLVLMVSDSIEAVGDRIYIKATAKISDGTNSLETTAYAREPESKKGSDESQITGAASSYARKYALCGLFAIDDNKDADATNTHGKEAPKGQASPFTGDKDNPERADLIATGEKVAMRGMDELKVWFESIGREARAVIGVYELSRLKDIASETVQAEVIQCEAGD